MFPRPPKFAAGVVLAGLILGIALDAAPAQPPQPGFAAPPVQPAVGQPEGTEVLARGPVHEAYAASAEQAGAGEVAPQSPPEPVEELPPDQKPDGDNVTWIPGYWVWDEERTDFIWVSGFWRVPPPGRVWVPGSWHAVQGGHQWVSGFWQPLVAEQPGAPAVPQDLEYLPAPPAPLEMGPAVPSPAEGHVYVPGNWVWRGRYLWRPGVWIVHRPGWVYTPASYRWTPVGHVYVDGYWDYPLAARGVLFTPVYFDRRVLVREFVYTPTYVVAEPVLFGALFVRRGYGSYYFGDYYDQRYTGAGFRPWCAPAVAPQLNIAFGRGYSYDPLWSYYSAAYRSQPQWNAAVATTFVGRYRGDVPRPPRTLVQQNTAIQQVTNTTVANVTNNITVVNNNVNKTTVGNPAPLGGLRVANQDVSNVVMVAPLAVAARLQPQQQLRAISPEVRQKDAKTAGETRQFAAQRRDAEVAALKANPPAATPKVDPKSAPLQPQPTAHPVRVKLDAPKAAVARAQVQPDGQLTPPTPPIAAPKLDPKLGPADPRIDPKGGPIPKIDPTPPFTPKVNPKHPKLDPKLDPTPKGKSDPTLPPPQPKVDPTPKGEPKLPTPVPVPRPKVDLPLPTPQPKLPSPVPQPKAEPKLPPPPTPVPQPKVEPKVPAPAAAVADTQGRAETADARTAPAPEGSAPTARAATTAEGRAEAPGAAAPAAPEGRAQATVHARPAPEGRSDAAIATDAKGRTEPATVAAAKARAEVARPAACSPAAAAISPDAASGEPAAAGPARTSGRPTGSEGEA